MSVLYQLNHAYQINHVRITVPFIKFTVSIIMIHGRWCSVPWRIRSPSRSSNPDIWHRAQGCRCGRWCGESSHQWCEMASDHVNRIWRITSCSPDYLLLLYDIRLAMWCMRLLYSCVYAGEGSAYVLPCSGSAVEASDLLVAILAVVAYDRLGVSARARGFEIMVDLEYD
jgi:hypothetical protein